MKYEKPQIEVMDFDFSEFMTGSGDDNDPGHGHTCGTYVKGQSCGSWSTTSFGGGSCSNYNGKKCFGYTDSTHSYCKEYGVSCGSF